MDNSPTHKNHWENSYVVVHLISLVFDEETTVYSTVIGPRTTDTERWQNIEKTYNPGTSQSTNLLYSGSMNGLDM